MTDNADENTMLLEYLRDRDAACPVCRYNLRGLMTPRCPECGRDVKLTVGMVEPYLSAWGSLAILLGASAGIGLLILCVAPVDGLPQAQSPGLEWLVMTACVYHVLMLPCAIGAVIWRRFLLRLCRRTQWMLFGVMAVLGATMLIVLTMTE